MQFDDRLGTVLRQSARGEVIDRIQYRQLLDLLGTSPAEAHGTQVDEAYRRLAELNATIPAAARRTILETPGLRLRNTRLVAELANSDGAVAAPALAAADLDEEQWLDLVPALAAHARTGLRRRAPSTPRVVAMLERLGVVDRGLPDASAASDAIATAASATVLQLPPRPPAQPPAEPTDGIAAIVRRIEAFRRLREGSGAPLHADDPRLPLEDEPAAVAQRTITGFAFATDVSGRIHTADAEAAPMVVGLNPFARDAVTAVPASSSAAIAFRRRLPLRDQTITLNGAEPITGAWQLDAAPRFETETGRFLGFIGRFRRRLSVAGQPDLDAANRAAGHDRLRQILHELRTPVNAIQGFAEATQQGLFGAIGHEYRALAASIAADSARILAAFEDLDRLVRLGGGTQAVAVGDCDLAAMTVASAGRLDGFTSARQSGFAIIGGGAPLPVAMAGDEAERLLWRLLATLAGCAAPGERLALGITAVAGEARLTVALPAVLARHDGDAVFSASAATVPQALSAGMFGTGFALRLAREEARAAGGSLTRQNDTLVLALPHLTAQPAPHSQSVAAPDRSTGAAGAP